jgi:hypothetical protein
MLVMCINNKNTHLTLGRPYQIMAKNEKQYLIYNEYIGYRWYAIKRFIEFHTCTLQKYQEMRCKNV